MAEQQDIHRTQIGVERSAGTTAERALDVTLRDASLIPLAMGGLMVLGRERTLYDPNFLQEDSDSSGLDKLT